MVHRDTRAGENALRGVVLKGLENKVIGSIASKVTTIMLNEQISPAMLSRLVVPSPELSRIIENGLQTGLYTGEPVTFPTLRDAFDAMGSPLSWEICMMGALDCMSRALLRGSDMSHKEFLRHSMATAAGARSIARHHGMPELTFYLSGLFHDIGIPLLAHAKPDDYNQFPRMLMGSAMSLEHLEQRHFGFDHQEVGSTFLMTLTAPDAVWQTAAQHHFDGFISHPVISAVRISANVSHQVGCTLGIANAPPAMPPHCLTDVGLDETALVSLAGELATAAGLADRYAA